MCTPNTSTAYKCKGYRLPTEAEWEYAARAGSTKARYGAINKIAWYGMSGMHPVAQKAANRWGLYDMLGSVHEWCHDWYGKYPNGTVTDPIGPLSGTDRVLRGGSYFSTSDWIRAAYRRHNSILNDAGFRPVRTIP